MKIIITLIALIILIGLYVFITYNSLIKLNNKVKESQNILSNVTNKTKRMVNTTPENKPVFNINKIDKVSLEDLKQILENIKRDEEFAFDYEPKKLKRTRDE